MILVINVCAQKLHYFEFVKPVEDVLKKAKIPFLAKHYSELEKDDFANAEKIIICGTSLKDNQFAEDIDFFRWIKNIDKPILGIRAGMQIIGLTFGGGLKKKTEIGFFIENFEKEFLSLKGSQEVYHLHNNFVDFSALGDFEILSGKEIPQAVKHMNLEIYGVLFHPEVRNKKLILNFISLSN